MGTAREAGPGASAPGCVPGLGDSLPGSALTHSGWRKPSLGWRAEMPPWRTQAPLGKGLSGFLSVARAVLCAAGEGPLCARRGPSEAGLHVSAGYSLRWWEPRGLGLKASFRGGWAALCSPLALGLSWLGPATQQAKGHGKSVLFKDSPDVPST